MSERDDRWEWHEIASLDGQSRWIKGRCLHAEVVRVESGGELVAHLCVTCGQQLPKEWRLDE